MGSKKKIKAVLPPIASRIQAGPMVIPADDEVRLSFKYLSTANAKFSYGTKETGYFTALLERLREFCRLTHKQLMSTHRDVFRCHEHKWDGTSEPNGFGLKGQLADCKGWQFQISSNAHG